jgi:hypothetical protein
MRLILSWPCQVLVILASIYLSLKIAALLFFTGIPISLASRLNYAPFLLYCVLNFGIPMAILSGAILGSETRNSRIVLAENGMASRLFRNWKTQNLVFFLIYLATFVALRVMADFKIAALLQTLER